MMIKKIIIIVLFFGVVYLLRIFLLNIPFIGWAYEAFEIKISVFLYNFVTNPILVSTSVIIIILTNVILFKKNIGWKYIYIQFILYVILLFWIYEGFRIENLISLGKKITIEVEKVFATDNKLPQNLDDITKYNFDQNEASQIKENFKYELDFAQPIPKYGYKLDLEPTFLKYHRFVCKPWTKKFIMFD